MKHVAKVTVLGSDAPTEAATRQEAGPPCPEPDPGFAQAAERRGDKRGAGGEEKG